MDVVGAIRSLALTEMTPKKHQTCQRCGYVPIDICLLDVVHIDGCPENYDPSNYLTLCANCQSYIAAMNDDDLSPEDREEVREGWRQGALFN